MLYQILKICKEQTIWKLQNLCEWYTALSLIQQAICSEVNLLIHIKIYTYIYNCDTCIIQNQYLLHSAMCDKLILFYS